MLDPEPEIIEARLAFWDAQDVMEHVVDHPLAGDQDVSWYGSSIQDERGSFALVRPDNQSALGLPDLVGDHLRITYGARSINVYVIGTSTDILTPIAVTRRAFMELDLPTRTKIACHIEVLL